MAEGSVRIPQPGETVAGKYRLLRVLGEGGMGIVFAAEHLRLRQPVAIKLLNPDLIGVDEIVQRFDREARAAATLRSRHVVKVTDVEQTIEGLPYMVMELLDGSDLESERARRGCLPYAEVVDYVLQACAALAEAHDAGIVHRDLKPGNLFLAKEDADRPIVKVLDFGISKFLKGEDAKLTSAGAIMGTALYMSPEQIRGDASIDARSDIWALGVILYELIGGDPPWMGPTTRVAAAIVSEDAPKLTDRCPLPEPLAKTIHAMLEKKAVNRPQTIADVVFALAPFAPPGSIGAEVVEQLARRSQRHLGANVQRSTSSPSLVAQGSPSLADAATAKTFQMNGPTRSAPERSTMAATTTSATTSARPRALWGALAAFCVLALTGVGLIVFVARAKPPASNGASVSASPAVVTAEPAPSVVTPSEPEPTPTEPTTPSATVAATAAVQPPAATAATAVAPTTAASARKPAPSASTAKTTARPPAPKPTETASPVVNPPFLK